MSLKRNIVASYAGQLYVTLAGIVMVPIYLKYMGAESYGLVGFFVMLQAWFQLLDMGLTPTMARETARFNGGAVNATSLRRLLRALEGIFIVLAGAGTIVLLMSSNAIATNWLKVQHTDLAEVEYSVQLMSVLVALRWVSGLYRGAISGFERMVWLSLFNVGVATARFVLVIPVFIFIGARASDFFTYQLVVAVLELIVLVAKTYRTLPAPTDSLTPPWAWGPLRDVLKFSLSIAFSSSVWVFVAQSDKLVLSKLLPLSEYAYFTVAVLVSSGIAVISGPVSMALQPRLTRLCSEGADAEFLRVYRGATQLVTVIAVPVTLMLAVFADQVLWAWTGDHAVVSHAAPVLTLYALGNGILALAAFPYYLQIAKGDLRLHLIGHALFVVFLIPTLVFATLTWGVIGAGYAWLVANTTYFLLWVPLVHRRFFVGLHRNWLLRDVGVIALLATVGALVARKFLHPSDSRLLVALELLGIGLFLLALAAAGSSSVRTHVTRKRSLPLSASA